jgi:hypothetical protein
MLKTVGIPNRFTDIYVSKDILVGTTTPPAETANGQMKLGADALILQRSAQVTPAGTLDLTVNTDTLFGQPGGFVGILNVSAVRLNFNTQSTRTVYAVVARGTTFTFTSLASQGGVNGGSAFTLTMPSNGVIRFTDTSGSGSNINVSMSFIGSKSAS